MSETKENYTNKVVSLRKKEVDVFSDFEENTVINIEILRHSIYKCLYSTKDDDTFKNFLSELSGDKIATIHFKKSMIFEKYLSICTNHSILLVPTSSKDQINKALLEIQNCEVYCIDNKDRERLTKYENSKLLKNFASEDQLKDLRETLQDRINQRFEVINGVQSVTVCYRTTYMTFVYLIEDVVSPYYDLKVQSLEFPPGLELLSSEIEDDVPTVIPFYYEENDKNLEQKVKVQANESTRSPPQSNAKNIHKSNPSPVFIKNTESANETENPQRNYNKVVSLRKKEVDVFSDFEENTVINIEILRHSIYKCLYSTKDDDTFKNFLSELSGDKIATIHFKKSMIFEKYLSICTNHSILLVPTSSKDQINKALLEIQNCEVYCIDNKDRERLTKYENLKILKNFASTEKLEELRETLQNRINQRFEVFNGVQSVMVCYRTTYMTFVYLIEDAVSAYYDLTPQSLEFPSDSESSSFDTKEDVPTVIPFYYEEQGSHNDLSQSDSLSNSNLNQNILFHKVPSLPKKEIDIFRDFQENQITDIEVLPYATFRCLYSTANDDTFHKFVSEIKDDAYATVHFKKSMIYEKYACICTDYHALLLPYESTDQINEVLSQIQNIKVFCVAEKDRDKLTKFENHKLIKSFATNDDLEKLRETLHAKINERFEVFNTSQSVMVCYRTTYMTFFYLTEEVLSTYYDLKTKSHKFLKTSPNKKFSYQSNPIKQEDLPKFRELYKSLDNKIKALHYSISGNDSYMGADSTLIDVNDYLQLSSNHKIKKGLTDCVKTYEKANKMIKETEELVDNFINSFQQQGGSLPPLTRNLARNKDQESSGTGDNDRSKNFSIEEDNELKKLKYEVETVQNKINQVDQQIRAANSNEFSLSRSYNSPPRRKIQQETTSPKPPSSPKSPSSPRNSTTSSPRTMRNRLRMMQKRVEEGDVLAMYSLGACYALGDGVPEDKAKAFYYYSLAAEKGNKNAQYAAASCHSYGKGTPIDKSKAFDLYLSAAEQGHPKAQFAVAHFFEYGQGGAGKNHETAKEWYRKAAEQGHPAARKFLDDCLSEAPILTANEE